MSEEWNVLCETFQDVFELYSYKIDEHTSLKKKHINYNANTIRE